MFYRDSEVAKHTFRRYSESSTPAHSPCRSVNRSMEELAEKMDRWPSSKRMCDDVVQSVAGSSISDAEFREGSKMKRACTPKVLESLSGKCVEISPIPNNDSVVAHNPSSELALAFGGCCSALMSPAQPSSRKSVRTNKRLLCMQRELRCSRPLIVSSSAASDRTVVDYGASAESLPKQVIKQRRRSDKDLEVLRTAGCGNTTWPDAPQCSQTTRGATQCFMQSVHNNYTNGVSSSAFSRDVSCGAAPSNMVVNCTHGSCRTNSSRCRSCPVTFASYVKEKRVEAPCVALVSRSTLNTLIPNCKKPCINAAPHKVEDALAQYRLAVENVKKMGYGKSIREILANPCVDDDELEDENDVDVCEYEVCE
uniref:Uncharacterized protein TCIL3000_11_15330 n=1 Tax=Trypanosoma congolense (strain IL3000) TaxID=1068625 RepID=G0V2Z3_TRYCI|nr:unnamed protein product [Trypanosoma congolense IL3000]